MLIGVVGRSDNKVSVVNLSGSTGTVMPALGSDITVPGVPTAIFIRESSKGVFAYVLTDTSFSAINLNFPNGPSTPLLPENTLTLGNGPSFATINSKGTLAYIVNNQKDLYFVDLSTPDKPKIISTQKQSRTCGYCAFGKDEQSLFIITNEAPYGGPMGHVAVTQFSLNADGAIKTGAGSKVTQYYVNDVCVSSFVSGETSKVVYVAGGVCLDMYDLKKEYLTIPTLPLDGPTVALIPSATDSYGAFVAYGNSLIYVYYNQVERSVNFSESIKALAIDDKSSYGFIASGELVNGLMRVNTNDFSLSQINLPWQGPYTSLAVQTTTGGISAPNPKPPTKPKPSKPPKKCCPKKCCKKKKSC